MASTSARHADRPLLVLVVVVLLVAIEILAIGAAAVDVCASTGDAAPSVVTLRASKTNPTTDAWVVSPDCSLRELQAESRGDGQFLLTVESANVAAVASAPSGVDAIAFVQNPATGRLDFSGATKTTELTVTNPDVKVLSMDLPASLQILTIANYKDESLLQSYDGVNYPESLATLWILNSAKPTTSLGRLPSKLKELVATNNRIALSDFSFPSSLQSLSLSNSVFPTFENVVLPSKLSAFLCASCSIKAVHGVAWPRTLKSLSFKDNAITEFEIRQSDLATFQGLTAFTASVSTPSCAEGTATKVAGGITVCVISDDRFNEKYGDSGSQPSGTTTTPTPSSSSASASNDSAASGSAGVDASNRTTSDATDGTDAVGGSISNSPARGPTPLIVPTTAPPAAADAGGGLSSTVLIVLAVVGTVVLLGLGALFYRLCLSTTKRQSRRAFSLSTKDDRTDTPQSSSDYRLPPSSMENFASSGGDFRDDKELLRFRLEQCDVQVMTQLARGGFGVVYRGTYRRRSVAIKQMLPDAWRNDTMLAGFVDEIRLSAKLDHPKIVEFIGVTWSSVRDLSAIIELMEGGDLHATLRKYPESSGSEWTEPWTPNEMHPKTMIAMDVAEAVVYLHSFNAPIIHRDLKATNVLLDQAGNAKLSDFGISREMSIDETMTSEIGTAAWIAPEVLRGERYSEKADIYSLGVLLVELDRCSHPYANEPVLLMGSSAHRGGGGNDTTHVAHKNMQIAVLVSTGQLRPSASSECPATIAALIQRCVSFAAQDRPTVAEVFYELRQARRALDANA